MNDIIFLWKWLLYDAQHNWKLRTALYKMVHYLAEEISSTFLNSKYLKCYLLCNINMKCHIKRTSESINQVFHWSLKFYILTHNFQLQPLKICWAAFFFLLTWGPMIFLYRNLNQQLGDMSALVKKCAWQIQHTFSFRHKLLHKRSNVFCLAP